MDVWETWLIITCAILVFVALVLTTRKSRWEHLETCRKTRQHMARMLESRRE